MSARRSSAVTYPAPKAMSSSVSPKMCGSPHLASRITVTPARGLVGALGIPDRAEQALLEEARSQLLVGELRVGLDEPVVGGDLGCRVARVGAGRRDGPVQLGVLDRAQEARLQVPAGLGPGRPAQRKQDKRRGSQERESPHYPNRGQREMAMTYLTHLP